MCGCQKQEDKAGQEAVRLLQDIKTAVSITHRKGEAFVVLKSDVVIYMADMQILCFKSDFNQHFTKWKQDWDAAYQIQLRDFEAKNPELQTKLKSLDDQIAQAVSKTNTVKQAASEAVADLARRLDSEKDALLAQQARTSKAYEEYVDISTKFENAIAGLKAETTRLAKERSQISSDTLDKINRHIVDAKLTVPKISLGRFDDLFGVSLDNTWGDDRLKRPDNRRFFVKRIFKGGILEEYDWVFLSKVPSELEGSPLEEAIKSAYENVVRLDDQRKIVERRISEQEDSWRTALIPWENLHGIQRRQGSALVSKQQEIAANVQRITERLASLKGGGKEASDMVETEIQQRLQKITDEVDAIRNQRRQLLEDAARTASLDLKRESRAKFHQLLKQEAASAVQTGSKGDFSVPADIAYIYAERHRENGETLIWLLRVDAKSPDIRMSNSNTTSVGSDYDQFWMMDWKLD